LRPIVVRFASGGTRSRLMPSAGFSTQSIEVKFPPSLGGESFSRQDRYWLPLAGSLRESLHGHGQAEPAHQMPITGFEAQRPKTPVDLDERQHPVPFLVRLLQCTQG
jgi:hypothetical protein